MRPERWIPQEPSAHLVDRVMATVRRSGRRRRARQRIVYAAAALLLTGAGAALHGWRRSLAHTDGHAVVARRTEVELGDGTLAVLETGSEIEWHRRHVVQSKGNVF